MPDAEKEPSAIPPAITEAEKDQAISVQVEEAPRSSTQESDDSITFTPAEEKKILRRVGLRLIVSTGTLYYVCLLDRTNLGIALVAGMGYDLTLINYRYSIMTLVFFVTYVIFQPPSPIVVRHLGPRVHMSAITVAWGALTIGMGFVTDWRVMTGLRAILGVLEAGYYPSMIYLLSTWYTRYDMGRCYAWFYLLSCIISAFAGILGFAFMKLGGTHNIAGWRWIFILDGAITCGFGIIAYWWLVDFPDGKYGSWRFLNPRETQFMINRVNADRGDVQLEPFTWKKFLAEGRDPKVWAFACIFCFTTTITYALAFFLPLILRVGLGFSVQNSQILLAPPYFVGGVFMYLVGWAGDKWQIRGPFIIACMLVSLVGLPMIGWHPNPKIRYVGVFFLTTGSSACIPAIMAYQANNIRGQWKRAFCSASLVGFGGIGGIAGSLIFRTQDAPRYLPGIWACMAASIFNIIIIASLTIHFMRANNRAERGLALIENEPSFRYTY